MEFTPLYPNAVPPDKIIDNLIRLLSDEEYQAGALAWASPDEALEPYVLVSESAVWREDMSTPALLIKDVTAEVEDDEGPLLRQVLRFSVYQALSMPDGEGATDTLMREAYRRNAAVAMMIMSADKSGFDLFEGTGISPGGVLVQVKRRNYGDSFVKGGSYIRIPSVDVEMPMRETQ